MRHGKRRCATSWPCSAPRGWASAPTRSCATRRSSSGLPALVKEALAAGTPWAVETALDRRRWSYLDELEAGTQFDLGRLVAYRLKLLLLERKALFRPEPGRRSFAEGYARVLGDAAAWTSAAGQPTATEKGQ